MNYAAGVVWEVHLACYVTIGICWIANLQHVVSFSRNCRFCVEYHCETERFSVITAPWHETLSSDTATWLRLAPCSTQSRMFSFSTVDWTPAPHFSLTSSTLWQGSVCDSRSMACLNQMEFVHRVIFLCGCNPSLWERRLWKQGRIPERVVSELIQLKTKVGCREFRWKKSVERLWASTSQWDAGVLVFIHSGGQPVDGAEREERFEMIIRRRQ